MMGRREGGQGQFFYAFDLDKVVPPDHLVRQIDAMLDLSWVHKELAAHYSHTGRPSIDPVLMIRMHICPGGAELTSTGNIDQGHIVYYRANKNDCSACLLKPKCTTAPMRKVTRDVNEDVRDCIRALANTEAFQQSRRERKKVEMRFAHMKRILKLDRLRLRGLSGAKDEVLLTAIAQNLRRLAKLLCRARHRSWPARRKRCGKHWYRPADAATPSMGAREKRTIQIHRPTRLKKGRVLQHSGVKRTTFAHSELFRF